MGYFVYVFDKCVSYVTVYKLNQTSMKIIRTIFESEIAIREDEKFTAFARHVLEHVDQNSALSHNQENHLTLWFKDLQPNEMTNELAHEIANWINRGMVVASD